MKIGIFGGTFDPIHEGHLALARAAQKQYHLDKILVIPNAIPPFKHNQEGVTSPAERFQMIQLAIAGERKWEISRIELDRGSISYTIDTLETLKSQYPNADFYLILGEDCFNQIGSWKESRKIFQMVTFLIGTRKEDFDRGRLDENAQWIQMPVYPISSSDIREKIQRGEKLGKGLLPPKVEQYIRQKGFYRGG